MSILKIKQPNPVSKEAIEVGCSCPVIDNHYGKGYQGRDGEYCYNMACPVHTMSTETLQETIGIK